MKLTSGVMAVIVLFGFINSIDSEDIPKVHFNHLDVLDPPGFTVRWDPLGHKDDENPIIGIKIKIWQPPCIKKLIHKNVDGKQVTVEQIYRQKFGVNSIPDGTPEIHVIKADNLNHTVPTAEISVWYHVRALAFTKTAEGPLSSPFHFRINPSEEREKYETKCKTYVSTPSSSADRIVLI